MSSKESTSAAKEDGRATMQNENSQQNVIETSSAGASETNNDVGKPLKPKKTFYEKMKRQPVEIFVDPITEKLMKTKFKAKDCVMDEEEMEDLRMISSFKDNELKVLRLKFNILSEQRGFVTKEDLKKIPEISINPLKDRVVCCFDEDMDSKIDFREFVSAMSVLSQDGNREQKLRFAFRMHDFDGDDKISKADLSQYLTLVTSIEKTPEKLNEMKERKSEEEEAGMVTVDDRIEFNQSRIEQLKAVKDKKLKKGNALIIAKYQNRIKDLEESNTVQTVVERAFEEASSDQQFITLEDFSRVVGASDFQGKLVIQIC